MARKANIIKSLEMMGYSVINLGSMYKIVLETEDGLIFERYTNDLELETGNFVVETIVNSFNDKIKNYPFKEVSLR